jgi:hypothetical protein
MAKKLVVPSTVTVYNPKGKPETHTRVNARDLVNGAGYSWEKKKPANPAASAPFALPQNTKFSKSKAQEVLDRVGATAADGDDDEEVFEGVDDGGSTGPINLPADDEDEDEAEEEAPAPAPVKKPRKPKQPKPAPAPEPEEVEGIEEE